MKRQLLPILLLLLLPALAIGGTFPAYNGIALKGLLQLELEEEAREAQRKIELESEKKKLVLRVVK